VWSHSTLDSMIDVVEEKLESTVRHTLEVDYVGLTTNTHSKHDDRLDSSNWLSATHNNNTMGAYIRELAYFPCRVAMLVPNAIKNVAPLQWSAWWIFQRSMKSRSA